MPLLLKPVPPSRGPRWIGDAWRLWRKKPLAFTALFGAFLLAALVVGYLPFVGELLQMTALPMLSLGFMVASQSALLGGPVHPRQFVQPLQSDPGRRRSLLIVCISFGVLAVAILMLCNAISGNALARLQALMAQGAAAQPKIDALMQESGVQNAVLIGLLLGSLLSIPYWHAAALVHWGGQRPAQALFSSTLAIWRSKGAFFLFSLAWLGLLLLFSLVTGLVLGLLGLGAAANAIAVAAAFVFSTLFYVAQLFTFNDSFGGAIAGTASLSDEPPPTTAA
jgi:hypothetical protein